MLMARNNPNYYREWGISNLTSFFKALNRGQIEITELLFLGMVRRSRLDVIKRQKAGEPVVIGGKEVRFPQRQLEKFTYNFEENYAGLYARLAEQIDQLHLAPYNINSCYAEAPYHFRSENQIPMLAIRANLGHILSSHELIQVPEWFNFHSNHS